MSNVFAENAQQGGYANPPNLLKYSNVLPSAPPSTSKVQKMPSVNGNTFNPRTNKVIRVAIQADAFLSGRESYIQFDLTNTGADAFNVQGSAHSLFSRLRLESANVEIDRIDNYGPLMSMLSDYTVSKSWRESVGHIQCGYRTSGVSSSNGGAALVANSVDSIIEAEGPGPIQLQNEVLTFTLPIIGFLSQEKFIPLSKLKNNQLILEMTLADARDGVESYNDAVEPTYTVSNFNYHATLVYFDGPFNNMFDQVLNNGSIQFHSTSYHYHPGHAGLGDYTLSIPERSRSIKAIYCIQRNEAEVNSNDYDLPRTESRSYDGIQRYQFQIGSTMYPQAPVDCTKPAEVYGELMKSFGVSLHSLGSNDLVIDSDNYVGLGFTDANDAAVPADLATYQASRYASAARGRRTGKFAFGIDTESMTRSSPSVESGLNTRDLSLPINVIVGRNGTANMVISSYVLFDQVITLLPDGQLLVAN